MVSAVFALAGDVASFNADAFRAALLRKFISAGAEEVILEVTPASINVDATIVISSKLSENVDEVAEAITSTTPADMVAEWFADVDGLVIEGVTNVTVAAAVLVTAPSPPPPSPPSPPMAPPPYPPMPSELRHWIDFCVVFGLVVGSALAVGLAFLWWSGYFATSIKIAPRSNFLAGRLSAQDGVKAGGETTVVPADPSTPVHSRVPFHEEGDTHGDAHGDAHDDAHDDAGDNEAQLPAVDDQLYQRKSREIHSRSREEMERRESALQLYRQTVSNPQRMRGAVGSPREFERRTQSVMAELLRVRKDTSSSGAGARRRLVEPPEEEGQSLITIGGVEGSRALPLSVHGESSATPNATPSTEPTTTRSIDTSLAPARQTVLAQRRSEHRRDEMREMRRVWPEQARRLEASAAAIIQSSSRRRLQGLHRAREAEHDAAAAATIQKVQRGKISRQSSLKLLAEREAAVQRKEKEEARAAGHAAEVEKTRQREAASSISTPQCNSSRTRQGSSGAASRASAAMAARDAARAEVARLEALVQAESAATIQSLQRGHSCRRTMRRNTSDSEREAPTLADASTAATSAAASGTDANERTPSSDRVAPAPSTAAPSVSPSGFISGRDTRQREMGFGERGSPSVSTLVPSPARPAPSLRSRGFGRVRQQVAMSSVAAAFKPTTQSLPSSAILQRLASSRAAALEAELETDKAAE